MNGTFIGKQRVYKYPCDDSTECNPILVNFKAGCFLFELYGAAGGNGFRPRLNEITYGGKGGYTIGSLCFMERTDVYLFIGGKGIQGNTGIIKGGYNGGGSGSVGSYNFPAGSGGGGTDIRIGCTSFDCRYLIAGGGGGAGSPNSNIRGLGTGGCGGGAKGQNSNGYSSLNDLYQGKGGSQDQGGAGGTEQNRISPSGEFGQGGSINNIIFDSGCGGGGGGYYGGGAGGACGGGGGSGFIPNKTISHSKFITKTLDGLSEFANISGDTIQGNPSNGYIKVTKIIDVGMKSCNRHSHSIHTLFLVKFLLISFD